MASEALFIRLATARRRRAGSNGTCRSPSPRVQVISTIDGRRSASSSTVAASQLSRFSGRQLNCLVREKSSKLRDDVVAARDALVDALNLRFNAKALAPDLAFKQEGGSAHCPQRIADFVGDGGGQLAQLLHATSFHQFVLRFLQAQHLVGKVTVERRHLIVHRTDADRSWFRLQAVPHLPAPPPSPHGRAVSSVRRNIQKAEPAPSSTHNAASPMTR